MKNMKNRGNSKPSKKKRTVYLNRDQMLSSKLK